MSTIKYETDDKKVITGCLDAITKFPYLDSPYETLYEKYKQTPAVTSIFSFLQFFGEYKYCWYRSNEVYGNRGGVKAIYRYIKI